MNTWITYGPGKSEEDIVKTTISFELPEEQIEFEMASKASDLFAAIASFERYLKSRIKYDDAPMESLRAIHGRLLEELEERGLDSFF